MLSKKIVTAITLLLFIGIGCASPGVLTSDEITNVAGVVLDANSYDRVANAQLQFEDDVVATTSSEGTFTLHEVNVGTHNVTIEADGYETTNQTVEIVDGGTRLELMIE